MRRIVLAQPKLEWDGFQPQAYVLDWEKIWELPLTEASSSQQMTIRQILDAFHEQKVEVRIICATITQHSVSTGIAVAPRDGTTRDELTRRADLALRVAKRRG